MFLVSLGGMAGALARYLIVYHAFMSSFYVIILINAIGSLIIGCLIPSVGSKLWVLIAIGFCGAFTTFSTYSLDTVRLIIDGHIQQAVGYVFLMNIISICFCWVGVKIVNA